MKMEPPIKPDESECCNSGCNPCILDVYEEQLKKFNSSLKLVQKPQANCLSLTSYSVFKLIDVKKHSKDCNLYTFEYVRPEKPTKNTHGAVLYEPGQYLLLKCTIYGETFQKAYTPIYIEDQLANRFTVLVKLYENGRMSRFFRRLTLGAETIWRGPYGDFKVNYNYKHLLLIAQGTGIAPFYSILCDMLNNEDCYTFITLFFCCNIDNILLRDELYKLGEFWNFKYELFISGSSKETFKRKYNEIVHDSRLGIGNIKQFLEKLKGDVKVMVCGAESFCDNIKNVLVQCDVLSDEITIF